MVRLVGREAGVSSVAHQLLFEGEVTGYLREQLAEKVHHRRLGLGHEQACVEIVDEIEQLPVFVIDVRDADGVFGFPGEQGHACVCDAGHGGIRGFGHRGEPDDARFAAESPPVYGIANDGSVGTPALHPSPINRRGYLGGHCTAVLATPGTKQAASASLRTARKNLIRFPDSVVASRKTPPRSPGVRKRKLKVSAAAYSR